MGVVVPVRVTLLEGMSPFNQEPPKPRLLPPCLPLSFLSMFYLSDLSFIYNYLA